MVLVGIMFDFTGVLETGTCGLAMGQFIENLKQCVEVFVYETRRKMSPGCQSRLEPN